MFRVLFFLKGFIWLIDVASVCSLKKFVQGTRQVLSHDTDKGTEAWRSWIRLLPFFFTWLGNPSLLVLKFTLFLTTQGCPKPIKHP